MEYVIRNILGKIGLIGMDPHFKFSIVCWFGFHTDCILFRSTFYRISTILFFILIMKISPINSSFILCILQSRSQDLREGGIR